MSWYAWLIIGSLSTICVVLIVLYIYSKRGSVGLSKEERDKLAENDRKTESANLEIEKKKVQELEKSTNELLSKLEQYKKDKIKLSEVLDDEARENYTKLVNDTHAIANELDELLDISRHEVTDPQLPGSYNPTKG